MGYFWGGIGILCFSLTLPATKLTVGYFDPLFVGLGRAALAGILGLIALGVTKTPIPPPKVLVRLGFVAFGLIGFGVFTSLAMQHLPSSHGAVVIGLLPLATAVAGTLLAREKHGPVFWAASILGSLCVVLYSLSQSGWFLGVDDLYLFLAVVLAAFGYAEGGRLSREYGGWKVISWALVVALPVTLTSSFFFFHVGPDSQALIAWSGFLYAGAVSQYLGFFAWYYGLAKSGIGKVGQLQLMQPFLTILFSVLFLSEKLNLETLGIGALVVFFVFLGRWDVSSLAKKA